MTILYYNVHIGCTCGCRDVPSKHFVILFMFVGEIRGLCLLHFFLQLLPLQLLQLQHVHMLLRSNRRGWICKSPQLDPHWDRKGFQWISSDSHRCYDAAGLLNIETNLPTVLETIQQPALPQPAWAFLPALAIAPFLAAVRPAVPATLCYKHGTNKPCMSLSKQDQIGMCGMSIWPQKKTPSLSPSPGIPPCRQGLMLFMPVSASIDFPAQIAVFWTSCPAVPVTNLGRFVTTNMRFHFVFNLTLISELLQMYCLDVKTMQFNSSALKPYIAYVI